MYNNKKAFERNIFENGKCDFKNYEILQGEQKGKNFSYQKIINKT